MIEAFRTGAVMSGLAILYGAEFVLEEFTTVIEEAIDWLETLADLAV